MSGNNTRRTVKTADTLFDIIEKVQKLDGCTVTELANNLDIAKSTAHTYLSTLEQKEYITKDGNTYNLSLKFLDHGMHTLTNHKVASASRPSLKQTAEETGELVWLIVEEHGRAVYLDRAKGDKAVQTNGRRGLRTYLHVLAAGKAILAHMDDKEMREVIDRHGLPAQTENTITNRETLFRELERARERGYAYNNAEEVNGVRAIGAPIIQNGTVYGGVSIAGPIARFQDDEYDRKMRKAVEEVTNTIELDLQY
ncbi:IclR family transcriptional regulator [Natrinema versiforme]|uniref:IclR family transcriptional regulator n=1 Tax=Natrinema versiforme TaxID=88724 RepID=A0A4P8WMA5_9EURY|nr:IclR family transcriptional regulator [Natrinema versiforme]QCS44708.1 IclR family transcriptional regulator [Natrinema versiforme]